MIKKILLIVAVVTLFASVAVMLLAKDSNEGKIGDINNYSKNYIYNRQEKLKKEKEENEKVVAKLKGVACWVGSNTVGYVYANYIDFLYEDLKDMGYDLPVENKGVKDESTVDVLGRQGSIPIIVGENTEIDGTNNTINDIKIKSSSGANVNILCGTKNPGVNPCSINGVKGTLFGKTSEEDATKTSAFYFQREISGEKVEVPAGTVVQTEGSDAKYKDYINIIWLERKGWSTPKELLEQTEKFVESINGKYIIIGLSDGDENTNKEVDKLLEEKFGDKFINSRKLLVDYAKSDMGKNTTESNKGKIAKGIIPSNLADNNGLLSVTGCKVLSKNVCDKIKTLGYLN